MDRAAALRALDEERQSSCVADAETEVLPQLTRVRGRAGEWHCIEFSRLDADNADRIIHEQANHYRQLKADIEWKVYSHDSPGDLLPRLECQGFHAGPRESVLALDLRERPAWVARAPTHRVQRVLCFSG
jgi:hypothetical protein